MLATVFGDRNALSTEGKTVSQCYVTEFQTMFTERYGTAAALDRTTEKWGNLWAEKPHLHEWSRAFCSKLSMVWNFQFLENKGMSEIVVVF